MFMLNFRSNDASKPSFFEMYAQHELVVRMKPALHYIFSVLSMRYPERFQWLVSCTDEVFYGVQLLVEKFYLEHYDASFSENFYSLRRNPILDAKGRDSMVTTNGDEQRLSRKHIWVSLFFIVVVPYLKSKADAWYLRESGREHEVDLMDMDMEREAGELDAAELMALGDDFGAQQHASEERNAGIVEKARALLVKAYPFLNAGYEGSMLVYQVLYMHDYTRYYNWFLQLQKIDVKRMSFPEMLGQQQAVAKRRAATIANIKGSGLVASMFRLMLKSYYWVFDYAPYMFPVLFLAFKFAEWWYSENSLQHNNKPIPPAPVAPSPSSRGLKLPENMRHCAICKHDRTMPAVLSVSGFAFCYPCIYNFVEERGHCPVSQLPANTSQIRRIYENT